MNEEILTQLNDSQREAVMYCDGAELVIAGAGSGKTRVLTYKIAYLLQIGYRPWNILALTFTNKAAMEMKERISKIVGFDKARLLNMGTFHSVFSRILRAEASHIGYGNNFTIYDQNDSRFLIKTIIKEMGLDEKQYSHTVISDRISMAKNHLITPNSYSMGAQPQIDVQRGTPAIKDIYKRYVERCRKANVMDFDDLLLNTYKLFSQNEEIWKKYVERFHYVLVDEYQDTNFAQQSIVMLLTQDHHNICVVGDDAQSIYGFRGANIDNILDFTNIFGDAKLFKLEQNYRSTQMIVQAANSLIRHNERQISKNVFSDNEHGDKVLFKQAYSDREEAAIVCNAIKKLKAKGNCGYCDFAVLYRTNSQSRCIEEEMRKNNIPYRVYGGLSFYQRKEIKDIIAYFRLVINPYDEDALRRVINYPTRGIGDTTLNKIANVANENGINMWTVIKQPKVFGLNVNNGVISRLSEFCSMFEIWRERLLDSDAYILAQEILTESGMSKEISKRNAFDDQSRQENVVEFLAGVQDFVESRQEEGLGNNVYLSDFLQEVSLLTDIDSTANNEKEDDRISLMTIHSAKGLEFQTVFIVGVEENIIPSPISCNNPRELEEERRLLYVAITRARKRCFLTCAKCRYRYGRMEFSSPSRFIKDIDPAYIKAENIGDDYSHNKYRYRTEVPESKFSNHKFVQQSRSVANFSGQPNPSHIVLSKSKTNPQHELSDSLADKCLLTMRKGLKPICNINHEISAGSIVNTNISIGNVIEHQRFGIGTVIGLDGIGENLKATVRFNTTGTKQLLLKFARYKIIK